MNKYKNAILESLKSKGINIPLDESEVAKDIYSDQEWGKIKDKIITQYTNLEDVLVLLKQYEKEKHGFFKRPPETSFQEIFSKITGKSVDKVLTSSKKFLRFQEPLVFYAAYASIKSSDKKSRYKYSQFDEDGKKLKNHIFKDLETISIDYDKEVQVPKYIQGIFEDGENIVLALFLKDQYGRPFVQAFSDKESSIEDFFEWVDKIIVENNFLKGKTMSPNMNFVKPGEKNWPDVVLKDKIKKDLQENIFDAFKKNNIFKANGIKSKTGFALVGPPGTGKTTVFKILCSQLKKEGVSSILATAGNIYSVHDIRDIYDLANFLSPCIVIMEDIDVWARDRAFSGAGNQFLNELMNCLDGVIQLENVVTGISSNMPESLEKALINRPGRIDYKFYLGPPDRKGQALVIKRCFNFAKVNPKDVEELIDNGEFDKLTHCQIEGAMERSIKIAISKGNYNKNTLEANVEKEDLLSALADFRSEVDINGNFIGEDIIYESIYNEPFLINEVSDYQKNKRIKTEIELNYSGKINWHEKITKDKDLCDFIEKFVQEDRNLRRAGIDPDTVENALILLNSKKNIPFNQIVIALTGGN